MGQEAQTGEGRLSGLKDAIYPGRACWYFMLALEQNSEA